MKNVDMGVPYVPRTKTVSVAAVETSPTDALWFVNTVNAPREPENELVYAV